MTDKMLTHIAFKGSFVYTSILSKIQLLSNIKLKSL